MIITQERQDFLNENSIDLKVEGTSEVLCIEWSPGNGSRYEMVFTKMPGKIFGTPDGAFAITDLNHSRKTMFGGAHDHVNITYVQEKLSLANGVMQTVLINAAVGDLSYAKALFEEEKAAR